MNDTNLSGLSTARNTYDEMLLKTFSDKLDKEIPSGAVPNAIGFVNFSQIRTFGPKKEQKRFHDVMPISGGVEVVAGVPPTEIKNADPTMKNALIDNIPEFVLQSFVTQIKTKIEAAKSEFKSKGIDTTSFPNVENLDVATVKTWMKNGGAGVVEVTSTLAFARFARCLNDTYLLKDIGIRLKGDGFDSSIQNLNVPSTGSVSQADVTGASNAKVTDQNLGAGKTWDDLLGSKKGASEPGHTSQQNVSGGGTGSGGTTGGTGSVSGR